MIPIVLRLLVGVSILASTLLAGGGPEREKFAHFPVELNIVAVLQPGVMHHWTVRPSRANGGYVVEVTPLRPPAEGNYIQYAKVLPVFDGRRWDDVLHVQLPDGVGPLKVNIRVYDMAALPLLTEFEAVLEPGVWHGWELGPASENRGYVADVTPMQGGNEGDRIEKIHFQPEYPGQWIDVLRLQIPETQEPLRVLVRVYETSRLPTIMDFDTILEPGVWLGYLVQPAQVRAGYIVEVSPLDDFDAAAEIALVQPEWDGETWNDVLRVMTYADRPPLRVNVRVYTVQGNMQKTRR